LHPVLFRIPAVNFELRSYGLMIALAFLAATLTASLRSRRAGISPEHIMDLAVYLIVSGVLGARLLYVIQNWSELAHWWEAFFVWRGGLVFYGGIIAAALAAVIFARLKKLPFLPFLDTIAPSVALGLVLGRIGCFLNGCCFGRPTNLPWGVVFPPGAFVYTNSVYLSAAGDPVTYPTPIHPTQLYSMALAVAMYVLLEWAFRKKRTFDGRIALLFGFIYPVGRFLIEFLRGDSPSVFVGMTMSQNLSAVYFVFNLFLYLRLRAWSRGNVP